MSLSSKSPGRGAVNFYVHGWQTKKTQSFTTPALIHALEVGLPIGELTELQAKLDLPIERLAPMLGISKATFHRSKMSANRLNSAVSDRVVRFAKLLGKAAQVFGNMEDAKLWLGSSQLGLGGAIPLDYAKTELGAREVENLLGRIEHGVYS